MIRDFFKWTHILLWNNYNIHVKLKIYKEIKVSMVCCTDRYNIHRIAWTWRGKVSHTIYALYNHVFGILHKQFQKTNSVILEE